MNLKSKIVPTATLLAALAMAAGAMAQDAGGGTSPVNGGTSAGSGGALSTGDTGKSLNIPMGPNMRIQMPGASYAPGEVPSLNDNSGADAAAGTPGFTIFAQAVTVTGLFTPLRGPGPYTVFAPSDSAFERIDKGPLDALLAPGNRDRLQQVLAYHVVPAAVVLDDIRGRQMFATLAGPPLIISRTASGAYTVNGANVIERDVASANGYVDVIDSVLFPGGRGPRDSARDSQTQ